MKSGQIILWYGTLGTIPYGWKHCDGRFDTPNLKVKWIVGAGSTFDPGDTGGTGEHGHSFTANGHNHNLPVTPPANLFAADIWNVTTIDPIVGNVNNPINLPPYHALYYIMKIVD